MTQALVVSFINDLEYRDYTAGQVVDFPADLLLWLIGGKKVDSTPSVVAAAIAGGATQLVHSKGSAPVDAGSTSGGVASGGLTSTQVKNVAAQRLVGPAAGQALTVATLAGAGTIVNFWFVSDIKSAVNTKLRLQMFYDGNVGVPDFDVPLETLLLAAHGSVNSTNGGFRNWTENLQVETAPETGGANLHYQVNMGYVAPYSSGCVVKIYNPTTTDGSNGTTNPKDWFFASVDYTDGNTSTNRLRSVCKGTGFALPSTDWRFIDVTGAGWLVYVGLTGTSSAGSSAWLERDFGVKVDSEATYSWRSSGTEDFFLSGDYYQPRTNFSSPGAMLTYRDQATGTYCQGADIQNRFGGFKFNTRLQLDWISEGGATFTDGSYVCLYYSAGPVTQVTPSTPSLASGNTGTSGIVASWAPVSGNYPITYTVTDTNITTGVVNTVTTQGLSYTFTGLTLTQNHQITVKATGQGVDSATATSPVITVNNPTTTLPAPSAQFVAADLPATNGASVSSWRDSTYNGHDLAVPSVNASGATAPVVVTAAAPNGQAAARFNGSNSALLMAAPAAGGVTVAIAVVRFMSTFSKLQVLLTTQFTGAGGSYTSAGGGSGNEWRLKTTAASGSSANTTTLSDDNRGNANQRLISSASSIAQNTWYVLTLAYDGTNISQRINGVVNGAYANEYNPWTDGFAAIGYEPGALAATAAQMDVAELVFNSGATTTAQILAEERRLGALYGITVA